MAKETLSLGSLADILLRLMPAEPSVGRAAALLKGGKPDAGEAQIDGQAAALKRYLDAIDRALDGLSPDTTSALRSMIHTSLVRPSRISTGPDRAIDTIARHLMSSVPVAPQEVRRLAVAVGRLLEEATTLQPDARRRLPLGRGFEQLFAERLIRRFTFLPDESDLLVSLSEVMMLLLEEPGYGTEAFSATVGRELKASERRWLEVERRTATIRLVRKNKTDEGHIRWFVRPDSQYDFVLERLGVYGHWISYGDVPDATDLVRLVTAVERVMTTPKSSDDDRWNILRVTDFAEPVMSSSIAGRSQCPSWVGEVYALPTGLTHEKDAVTLRSKVRTTLRQEAVDPRTIFGAVLPQQITAATPDNMRSHNRVASPSSRTFTLRSSDENIELIEHQSGDAEQIIASIVADPHDHDLIHFLDRLDRIADISIPVDQTGAVATTSTAMMWIRSWLQYRSTKQQPPCEKLAALRVRLVYVPSKIPHQLGGFPQIGLEFLRDRLEKLGARVDILTIPPSEYHRRILELLGADVIGIGIYVHNKREVATLVRLLHSHGYTGKIILGGPEVGKIDMVQSTIPGWDAIIRGEAEEVLPSVLDILTKVDAGQWEEALVQARGLRGVVMRLGDATIVCETAAKNSAAVVCPLPFDWKADRPQRRLQMNFTRGCPYQCTFCPNHQGRRFRSGQVDALWWYTLLAIADDVDLPYDIEREVANALQAYLGVEAPPRLPVALRLFMRTFPERGVLQAMCAPLIGLMPDPVAFGEVTEEAIGARVSIRDHLDKLPTGKLPIWKAKETWLVGKLGVVAARQVQRRSNAAERRSCNTKTFPMPKRPFVLETSEDNTLVNRAEIIEYLRRRVAYNLADEFVFNPGQNTIWDLTDKQDGADVDYIDRLVDRNPFAVALGADGTSNPVIRQNRKPFYRVHELVAVNLALARRQVEVANNYILLTAETDFLEAVESFLLFVLLPIPWRNYGPAINLRVIKEEATLSTDEGIVWAPQDDGFDVPLRFADVQQLLDRWDLTSRVSSDEIDSLLWRMIELDPDVAHCLPKVIDRWERDLDSDPTLVYLAKRIRARSAGGASLVDVLKHVQQELDHEYPHDWP
jgi:hypothetical protein